MSAELSGLADSIDCLKRGKVGIFPAKNGYMVSGLGSPDRYEETSERIRELKRKKLKQPLARVATEGYIVAMISEHVTPEAASFALRHLDKRIIWSFDTTEFPEECHDYQEVGVTAVRNRWEAAVVEEIEAPLIASSANLSGNPTPLSIEEIDEAILNKVDFAVDVGSLPSEPDYGVVHLPGFKVYRRSPSLDSVLGEMNESSR